MTERIVVGKWGQLLERVELGFEPTTSHLARAQSARHGDKLLLAGDAGVLSDADAHFSSRELARSLIDLGVAKGSRIGIMHANDPRWIISWLAVTRIGAVCVPLSPFAKPTEVRRVIAHSDLHLVITDETSPLGLVGRLHDSVPEALPTFDGPFHIHALPSLRGIVVVERLSPPTVVGTLVEAIEDHVVASDPMMMIYTSGSSGEPKGVIHSHGAVLRQAADETALYGLSESDRLFTTMPFFWIGGFGAVLCSVYAAGATVLTQSRFDPATAVELLERERATYVIAWPAALRSMREQPAFAIADLSSIRTGLEWPGERADGAVRHGSLGMTETVASHSFSVAWDEALPSGMSGSCGPAVPGIERRVTDPNTELPVDDGVVGELWVRGPNLMLGLHRREREDVFTSDGWYRTGDLGHETDGCFFFVGRLNEMIKTAGSNVSPIEVQMVLEVWAGVDQAIVIGLADDRRGQIVAACLVGEQPDDLDLDAIRAMASAELSTYKVPRVMLALHPADVPQLGSGKVDRQQLAERLAAALVSGEPVRRRP